MIRLIHLFTFVYIHQAAAPAAAFLTSSSSCRPPCPRHLSAPVTTGQDVALKKHILVTGANKGIGKAICHRLLQEHTDTIVWLGCRSVARGNKAAQDIAETASEEHLSFQDRLFVVSLDVTCDKSIALAVDTIKRETDCLYGIVNNAGVKTPDDLEKSLQINFYGTQRVNEAFLPLLHRYRQHDIGLGRIVHLASEFSGPNFVQNCPDGSRLGEMLAQPWTIQGGVEELNTKAANPPSYCRDGDAYGFSKALVCAYTVLLAQQLRPNIMVNAVAPGFIATDMTRGQGAVDPPCKGSVAPVWLLMSANENDDPKQPLQSGKLYGSDCQPSPLDRYRAPGDK